MTLMRVDLHTPAALSEQYVDAVDVELREIDEEIEQHRLAWMVLEDRRAALLAVRTAHVAALQTLTPPSTLTDLVAEPEEPPTT